MRRQRNTSSAFTLIELILVMVILAIVAGVVAPRLIGFSSGRDAYNSATQIVALAQYARTQSITEGRIYRLNFDPGSGKFWVTVNDGGNYSAPGNSDAAKQYTVPDGVKLSADITQQMVMLPDGTIGAPGSDTSENQGQQSRNTGRNTPAANYVQFLPTGRTDSGTITLTDKKGAKTQVVCSSATEMFHIAQPGEVVEP